MLWNTYGNYSLTSPNPPMVYNMALGQQPVYTPLNTSQILFADYQIKAGVPRTC